MFSLIILIYLADVCKGLNITCIVVFCLIAISLAVGLFAIIIATEICDDVDELKEKLLKFKWIAKTIVIAGVITSAITILTPSQKTMYMIAGSIIVNQSVNEVINSDLYKKLYSVINDKLDLIIKNNEKE